MKVKIYILAMLLAVSSVASAQYTIHVVREDGTDYTTDIKNVELFRWWNSWQLEMVGKKGEWYGALAPEQIQRIYWTKNDPTEETGNDIYMSEDRLFVRTADYSIKLDPTVLTDSTKLVVTPCYTLSDPFEGNVRRAVLFDFKLGDKHELTGTAEIRIPITVDEGFIPCAAYYNPSSERWEAVNHRYDSATGEIVITTAHLSTFGAFSVSGEYTREAKLSYLYMPGIEGNIVDVTQRLKRIIEAPNPALQALNEYVSDVDVIKSLGLDFGYASLESMGFLPGFSDEFGELLSNVGSALNIYQVCQAAYEGNEGAIAGGTLKFLLGKITGGLASALESSIMTASMAAVAFIDYSLNQFATTATEGRKDIYRAAYRHYYSKAGSECASHDEGYVGYRNAVDWYNTFYPIMQRTDLSEKQLIAFIDDMVTTFCNQIWEDENGLAAAMNAARNMGWTGGGGLNTRIKKELSDEYRSELYNGMFVSVFRSIKKHLEAENYDKLIKEVEAFGNLMNRVATIKFVDSQKGTDVSSLKGYKVQFVSMPSEVQDPEKWECTLDDNGAGYIQFRVFPYIAYGFEPKLALVNGDDETVKIYEFKLDYSGDRLQPTTVDLATAGIDVPDVTDTWAFDITPVSITHSSGATFLVRDEWNQGLKQLFDAERTISPAADGTFAIHNNGLAINGSVDKETGHGNGTFTINTSYEYVSPVTLEQREAWWSEIYKAVYDKARQGENATDVLIEKMAEYPASINDNWLDCSVQQSITGTFTMKYSQKDQKYLITFDGDGSFSLLGTGQYSIDYSDKEGKCTILTDRIRVSNGKTKIKATLVYDN